MQSKKDRIIQLIREENEAILQRLIKQYKELEEPEETLEQYVEGDRFLIKSGPAATKKQVEHLEALTKCSFPKELKEFYFQIGRIQGEVSNNNFTINFYSVEHLIKCFNSSTPKYEKLSGVGLIDMIRYTWGNTRPELEPGVLCSKSELDRLNNKYKSVAFIMDSYCESHCHIYFDEIGRFGLTYYHQDEFSSNLEPSAVSKKGLYQILIDCFTGFKKCEDNEELFKVLSTS